MNKKQIWGIIRHAIGAIGATLVSLGVLSPKWLAVITGALPVLDGIVESILVLIGSIGTVWAMWKSVKSPEKLEDEGSSN
jgi:hypothetical protein